MLLLGAGVDSEDVDPDHSADVMVLLGALGPVSIELLRTSVGVRALDTRPSLVVATTSVYFTMSGHAAT